MSDAHQPKTPERDSVEGVSAIVLSWQRPSNIPKIVKELLTVPFITEVIVWNNNPDLKLSFSNCKVINSSHNFMPFARYCAAILASRNTILFQDDDMLFPRRSIERAFGEYLKDKSRIWGTRGRNLQNGRYSSKSVFGECDIVLGQFMLFDKQLLENVFQAILSLAPFDRGDDIAFSLLCNTKHVALGLEFEDLGKSDEFALHKQADHREKRQRMVDRVMRLKQLMSERGTVS